MKKFLIAVAMLFSTPVMAAKPSVLCKAKDVDSFYTVVAIGESSILFQINANEYLEGYATVLNNSTLLVAVEAENGSVYMVVDGKTNDGLVKLKYKDGREYQHPIHCVYK